MAIIDAQNLILGRLASDAAKRALLGEHIEIINCEDAVITGNKTQILERYKERREKGTPTQGPFYPRRADMVVKRTIRGMLPYKKERGRKALARVRCHLGLPPFLEGKELETVEKASTEKLLSIRYISVGDICKFMGGSK